MGKDAVEIKEKIITALRYRGPSLPVHLAKAAGESILFTSAFLSELMSERRIKTSHMRVGSSPVYFLPGQDSSLQNFKDYLKSREKDAFILLKEKGFLKDIEQEPAIRVALREIKDFAVPFKINEETYWRFFTVPESEFKKEKELPTEIKKEIKIELKETAQKEGFNIFDKSKEKAKKEVKKKIQKKKSAKEKPKQSEKFLEKVKEFLSKSSTEILSIEGMKKDELTLKIKKGEEEQLLVAYNKKKIYEKDLIKAAKKAKELNLKYSVFSLGELPKKFSDLINALKDIKEIDKVE